MSSLALIILSDKSILVCLNDFSPTELTLISHYNLLWNNMLWLYGKIMVRLW